MSITQERNDSVTSDIEQELRKSVHGEVRFDRFTRAMYSTDASLYSIRPLGVVLPRNAADVQATVETANAAAVSVLPRGGGTGLSGQTVNRGIVIDFSKYMHRVEEVNTEEQWVRAQPGITIDELNRQLRAYTSADRPTLFFTPDPSTSSRANIGGAIGNNSCGAHSIIYGKTVDQVKALKVVLANGEQALFEELNADLLQQKVAMRGLEGAIYTGVTEIARDAKSELKTRFPQLLRRVGGYNLDKLQNTDAFNLAHLVTGSEGTLATVTEAKLHLWQAPAAQVLIILHFNSLRASMEAASATLEYKPAAVEHIGEIIISQARQSLGFGRSLDFLDSEPSDILVVEMTGDTPIEALSRAKSFKQAMMKRNMGYATVILSAKSDQHKVWAMRQAGLGLMMNVPGDAKPLAFVEDTAVAPHKLPDYVDRFDEIVRSHGTYAGYYGHASVGCMHIRPVVNVKTVSGIEQMLRISEAISDLVLEFSGSLTGEHGDGIVRGHWAEKMYGSQLVEHFRRVKATFDPQQVMNPGKIFDTPPLTENLRYGTAYRTKDIKTALDFSAEGGFAGAVEKCNGVGACRKVNAGAMCPSYMATREEEHSTRGRANALRAALSGALPTTDLYSERMMQVLDLCLECKSCKSECPSNVDMAKIKYEFLSTYYKTHTVPIRSRLVANVHAINRMGAGPLAPILNWLSQSRAAGLAMNTIKLHPKRRLPMLARTTFENWFRNHTPTGSGVRGPIIFFTDTFTNYNHPQAAQATIHLLEAQGYQPKLAPITCCGRPMVSKGFAKQARKHAQHNVETLYPYVANGTKIVGCEASCMGTLIDEYPDLLPHDKRAKEIANATVMLEELLAHDAEDGNQSIAWADVSNNIKLLVHCHERALRGTTAAVTALNLPPNYSCELIDSGCCGMAGAFGFEKEHYDISMRIGEDRLFPAVRKAASSDVIAITGISCKQQIKDGTNISPKYLSEVLAEALPTT